MRRLNRMRTLKLLIPVCAALLLCVSCVTTGSGNIDTKDPQYIEGLKLGEKMAQEHRNTIVCSSISRFQALQAAKKQTQAMRDQGKPEMFVKGFYRGYKDTYEDNVTKRCIE